MSYERSIPEQTATERSCHHNNVEYRKFGQ
jgi:hypothetical protein